MNQYQAGVIARAKRNGYRVGKPFVCPTTGVVAVRVTFEDDRNEVIRIPRSAS